MASEGLTRTQARKRAKIQFGLSLSTAVNYDRKFLEAIEDSKIEQSEEERVGRAKALEDRIAVATKKISSAKQKAKKP